MSRSREKTFTGPNRVREQRLRDLRKLAKTSAGTAEREAAYSPEVVREFIEAQICPWCGNGPYQVLASHTGNQHGVDRFELREMAGLSKTAPICAPEISQERSKARAGKGPSDEARQKARRAPRRLSAAGKAVMRAKLDAVRSPEQQQAATAASVAKRAERDAEKYQEILRLFADDLSLDAIAQRVGVSRSMVKNTLRRHGIADDLRKQRGPRLRNVSGGRS